MNSLVLLIKSRDQKGLVAKVTTFVYEHGINILDCQQHTDIESGDFFMRLRLDTGGMTSPEKELEGGLGLLAEQLGLSWSSHDLRRKERVSIFVSKASHCLYDLLVRAQEGELPCQIASIISNHEKLAPVAEQFGIPYHCLPITKESKSAQESAIRKILEADNVSLIVLARYMQILSKSFVHSYSDRIINIHHAFLPAFQGAKPYRQAFERGVKMIGATAHYVTTELDEGPIIEQDVERVNHEDSPAALQQIGRDVERVVLARAVKAHLEHRVITSGLRVVVFSSTA